MPLDVEGVADGCMDGEKPLGRHLGLELLHMSLALADGQM